MNTFSLILYGVGVVGIIICLVLTFASISKSGQASFMVIGSILLFSLLLIGIGTFFTLNPLDLSDDTETTISDNSDTMVPATENKDALPEKIKTASIDDLKFQCKFDKSSNMSQKGASITIENRSDSVFNGDVKLNFTDSSSQSTDSLTLPVKNLMPKSSYGSKVLVDKSADKADYSFSGTFDEKVDKNIPYTVKKISMGNNIFKFDVSVQDTSPSNIQGISNEFMREYSSSTCSGFLIYFYPPDKGNVSSFDDAIADFYVDYKSNTSKLTTYNK